MWNARVNERHAQQVDAEEVAVVVAMVGVMALCMAGVAEGDGEDGVGGGWAECLSPCAKMYHGV